MNRLDFTNWLQQCNASPKVISDHISRIMRLERVFTIIFGASFSLEKVFLRDKCESLFFLLRSKGNNPELRKYDNIDLPVGKSTMASIRYSLRTYCRFLSTLNSKDK